MKTTDYEKQAIDFLAETNTDFKAEFIGFKKHFEDDEHKRFCFKITLKRGSRQYSFNFGGSLKDVEDYFRAYLFNSPYDDQRSWAKNFSYPARVLMDQDVVWESIVKADKVSLPSAYDVLACLTKYEPGTFEDFCADYGYDTDSRKAEKIYNAVKDEFLNVSRLWNDSEIEKLQEMQ